MAEVSPSLNASNFAAASLLKLFGNQRPASFQLPPAQNKALNPSLIVGSGPLGAIKDETGDLLMSILQLGQREMPEAVAALPERAGQADRALLPEPVQSAASLENLDGEIAAPRPGETQAALADSAGHLPQVPDAPDAAAELQSAEVLQAEVLRSAALPLSKKDMAAQDSPAAQDIEADDYSAANHGFMGGGLYQFNLNSIDNARFERSWRRPKRRRPLRQRRKSEAWQIAREQAG